MSPNHSSSSSAFPAISLDFTICGEIFAYMTIPVVTPNPVVPSSWMVHAGCVFVASIHPYRT